MSDFEFYCDEYGGSDISDADEFERFAKKARLFINRVTCSEPDYEDEDIKSCLCAIAELYAASNNSQGVVREKIDDFEREYNLSHADDIFMHTVKLYLPPVLLYRGF